MLLLLGVINRIHCSIKKTPMGDSWCEFLDPSQVCKLIKNLWYCLLFFVLFGYLGKGWVLTSENDVSWGDILFDWDFWNPWSDDKFLIMGLTLLVSLFILLCVLRIFTKLMSKTCDKMCCDSGNLEEQRYKRLEELIVIKDMEIPHIVQYKMDPE